VAAVRSWPHRLLLCVEAVLIFVVAQWVYLANGVTIAAVDTIPARYLPLAILEERTFYLDNFPFLYVNYGKQLPNYLERGRGHYVSAYPVGAALAAVPFYVPAVLRGEARGSSLFERLEKVSAASIVAASVAILYLLLRLLTDRIAALVLTAVYAFGTSSLSVSSQGLWQHGPAQLALATALYLIVLGERRPLAAAMSGFPLAYAVICRPTNLLMVLPVSLYVLWRHPRQAGWFLLSVLPAATFQLWYNVTYFGDPLHRQFSRYGKGAWTTPLTTGLGGVLLSPGRGLFFYSPVLLFGVWGLASAWGRGGDWLLRAVGVGVALSTLLAAKWFMWWGGGTYGSRLLADLTPALVLGAVPTIGRVRSNHSLRALFVATALWSMSAHWIGAFYDDGSWNGRPVSVDNDPGRLWHVTDNPLIEDLGKIALGAMKRAAPIPEPVDPAVERRLLSRIDADPDSDRTFIALEELYAAAHDEDRVEGIRARRARLFSPQTAADLRFGGELALIGYDVGEPNDRSFAISWYWRAERRLAGSYAVFAHFIGPSGRFQDDYFPRGLKPGVAWEAGETVKNRRTITVPESLPDGVYQLRIGVWDPSTGKQLSLAPWWRGKTTATLLAVELAAGRLTVSPGRAEDSFQ
jgi:hypothetical protein